jgi:APA family basic amino acid/polyamine antiporter
MSDKKKLGFWMCLSLVIGNTIGMAIFMLPVAMAPLGPNAIWGWLIAVTGFLFIATVFAFMARQMPKAHGPYGYIRENIGNLPAFIAMWCYWVSSWVTLPALAIAVVAYIQSTFPHLPLPNSAISAILLIWLFVGINSRGAIAGGTAQVLTTFLKLVPLFAVIGIGFWVMVTQPELKAVSLAPSPINFENLMAATALGVFAMLGIESASIPSENVDQPERTIPRATYAGTLIVAVIYLSVTAVMLFLIPYTQLANSQAPFVDMLKGFLGEGVGRWMGIFVVISGLGALNGWTLLVGQMTRTMALNDTMPRSLSALNSAGAPIKALLLSGILGSILAVMSYSDSLADGYIFLSLVVTAANLPVYILTAIALLRISNRSAIANYTLYASIALFAVIFVILSFFGIGMKPLLWSLVLALLGLPVYWYVQNQAKKQQTIA